MKRLLYSVLLGVLALASFNATASAHDHQCGCAACARHAQIEAVLKQGKQDRLPRNFVAERYEVSHDLDVAKRTIAGEVVILGRITSPTDTVVLHARDMEIARVQAWKVKAPHSGQAIDQPGTNTLVLIPDVKLDTKTDRASFKFVDKLANGWWAIKISFKGKIQEKKLRGVYLCQYKDDSGADKELVSTQMEAIEARSAFPCLDEPDRRAVFSLKLSIPKEWCGGANGDLVSEKIVGEKKVLQFADTPRMASYLFAYTVGELEHTDSLDVDGVAVRVWATKGKSKLGGYALKAAAHSIRFYEKKFGVKYPFHRLDLVACPNFEAGAMENWGWIIYREEALLLDESAPGNESSRLWVAIVVTHEISHQWFGNLVTMEWWDGTWLNEGFATLMQEMCTEAFDPSLGALESFALSRNSALQIDGMDSSHPVEFSVTEANAFAMFDTITYQKGGSVLLMLKDFMGEERFYKGVGRYLSRHAFKNARRTDLWASLNEVIKEQPLGDKDRDLPVESYMDDWILRKGYPLLTVSLSADKVVVSQQPFKYIADKKSTPPLWKAPLFLKAEVDGKIVEKVLLLKDEKTTFDLGGKVTWALLDPARGFYRIKYSADLLKTFKDKGIKLSAVQQQSLVNDSWHSCQAQDSGVRLPEFLKVLKDFGGQGESVPSGSVEKLHRMLAKEHRPHLEEFLKKELGFAQSKIAKLQGKIDDKELKEAQTLFAKWQAASGAAIDMERLSSVVTTIARTGGKKEYDELRDLLKAQKNDPHAQNQIRYALTRFTQEELLKQTLQSCINGDFRTQDAPYLMRSVMSNPAGTRLTWKFIQDNWAAVSAYPPMGLNYVIGGLSQLTTKEDLDEVRAFFKTHPVPEGESRVKQTLEALEINVNLHEQSSELGDFLRKQAAPPAPAVPGSQTSSISSGCGRSIDAVAVPLFSMFTSAGRGCGKDWRAAA
jgi:puromycin-sensitive aminopeptidase